jgi:uncharacterized protein
MILHKFPPVNLIFLVFLCISISCATQQPVENQSQTETAVQTEQAAPDQEYRDKLHVLFLGDDGHHQPLNRLKQVIEYFTSRGIYIHYTEQQDEINFSNLKHFDVLMLYGNRSGLSKDQEAALLRYVNEGGGLAAIHSASSMFNDSDAFVNLIGGAFKAHGEGTFRVRHIQFDHPVKQGVPEFENWDETYVHMKMHPGNEILSVRVEDGHEEPWTWVRNQGDGRVFYTAWGHDERTWGEEGFAKLLENGIRWSAGDWTADRELSPPVFTYSEGEMPYYPEGESWGTLGDPITDVQDPLTPEESMEHIVARPEFEVTLFASEPDIVNPIDMAWDERGRLWITETVDYPNRFEEDREGNDRIRILEDTTGDGKADTFSVFADGLNIATGLVPYRGGVIVAQAPDFFFLKDTTGDGKADHKEVLFSGWGAFDTHAGPSNLLYGFDNQIWGSVGYSAFDGTVGGEALSFSSGFYRFKPDGSRLEYMAGTTNNTWGLGFSEDGIVFGSTANRDVPVHTAVPNRYYNMVRGFSAPRVPAIYDTNIIFPVREFIRQVDQHGRYTAGSGFEIYTARNFPESFWNRRAFVSEPTGHLLGQFRMEPSGSSFTAYNELNMLASLDDWFSPIQAKVGPDGALWVIDWYNLIIQHNPTPENFEHGEGNAYVTDLRDKDHGRIYRVVYKGDENNSDIPNLADASPEDLVQALRHDNMFWRLTAQRLIVERGEADVVPQLTELIRDQSVDQIGLNPGAFHALWTLHGLGALDEENGSDEAVQAAFGALHHPVTAVRRAALMTLPRTQELLDHLLSADFLPNPETPGDMTYTMPVNSMMAADPQLRLAALLALADLPSDPRSGRTIAEMILLEENANDRWIQDAATAAASKNHDSFLPRILEKTLPENADSTFKANAATVVERVTRHVVLGDDPGLAAGLLPDLTGADPAFQSGVLNALAEHWPENQVPEFTDQQREIMRNLRSETAEGLYELLDRISGHWDKPDLFGPR